MDISRWDESKVTDMSRMFWDSSFTGDISNWDVSNVTRMDEMFKKSSSHGHVSKWDYADLNDIYDVIVHGFCIG